MKTSFFFVYIMHENPSVFVFNSISTFVGYLIPKPPLFKKSRDTIKLKETPFIPGIIL